MVTWLPARFQFDQLRHPNYIYLSLLLASAAFGGAQPVRLTDTLAAAKLSKKEVRQLVAAVEQLAYDTPDSWNKELRVKRIDLGSGPGLVLEGTSLLCGGTGNCQTFVFRKANNKWISLFSDQAPIGDAFKFGPASTNGIKDFTITANSSAEAGKRVTYKFDGKFYRHR